MRHPHDFQGLSVFITLKFYSTARPDRFAIFLDIAVISFKRSCAIHVISPQRFQAITVILVDEPPYVTENLVGLGRAPEKVLQIGRVVDLATLDIDFPCCGSGYQQCGIQSGLGIFQGIQCFHFSGDIFSIHHQARYIFILIKPGSDLEIQILDRTVSSFKRVTFSAFNGTTQAFIIDGFTILSNLR